MQTRAFGRGPLWIALAFVCLTASAATAQPIGLASTPGGVDEEGPDGVTMFFTVDAGLTPYIATYRGTRVHDQLVTGGIVGLETKFAVQEREQRLTSLGGLAGARWSWLGRTIHLSVGAGASYLQLEENVPVPNSSGEFNNQQAEFRAINPNPGFSALLGFSWQAVRTHYFSVVLGVQVIYTSSYGLTGSALDGTDLTIGGQSDGDTLQYTVTDTTDFQMHLINFEPHVGMEWRPVGSVFTNSFGVFSSVVVSAAQMTKRVRTASDFFPGDGSASSGSLDSVELVMSLTMTPVQYIGAYYGWYAAIPHFGTLGLEVQVGARWNAELSYQYSF